LCFLQIFCDFYKYFVIFTNILRFLQIFCVFTNILCFLQIVCDFYKYFVVFTNILCFLQIFCDFYKYFVIFTNILRFLQIFCVFYKYFVFFTNILWFLKIFCVFYKYFVIFTSDRIWIPAKLQWTQVCWGTGVTVSCRGGLGFTVVVMHCMLRSFCNFDRIVLPASTGMLYYTVGTYYLGLDDKRR